MTVYDARPSGTPRFQVLRSAPSPTTATTTAARSSTQCALTVTSSTFYNNTSDYYGGAIDSSGTMSLTSCTFTNNTADDGGGIENFTSGTASIVSCTFSGNTANWAGGGICNDGAAMSIVSTIVAGNTVTDYPTAGPDIADSTAPLTVEHLLVQSTSGNGVTTAGGNIVGEDPVLGGLANNGGPTETMALLPGSPILGDGMGVPQQGVGAGNRLLSDGTYYYTFDAAGNRTAQYEITSGGDVSLGSQADPNTNAYNITIYTWNNANQMTSATFYATTADWTAGTVNAAGEYKITYGLDAFGRIVTRTAALGNGTSTTTSVENFIYDGQNIVLVLNAGGQVLDRNLTGPAPDEVYATEMVATVTSGPQEAGTVNWLLTDAQGTVRDVVQLDGTSAVNVDHLVYGAFGGSSPKPRRRWRTNRLFFTMAHGKTRRRALTTWACGGTTPLMQSGPATTPSASPAARRTSMSTAATTRRTSRTQAEWTLLHGQPSWVSGVESARVP